MALLMAAGCFGCESTFVFEGDDPGLTIECSIPVPDIHRGALRGVIPALTDPELAFWGDPGTGYLGPEDRVVGLLLDGVPVAIPLNILWWHEIVNLDIGGPTIAVTHCPLTGSTLAFDRTAVGAADFEVSGLLYENNLMMADVVDGPESLWPQMARGARCGPRDGTELSMIPVIETTWRGWQQLYLDTRMVTSRTGHNRDYTEYPYLDYDDPDNPATLFPVANGVDPRRPPKERELGIAEAEGGVGFPFGALDGLGPRAAVQDATPEGAYVVFWDRDVEGAMAYRPSLDGQELTFTTTDGRIFDEETGSEWRIDGIAVGGPLAGSSLEPIAEAFVAFWFAWPVFYPRLELWTGS